MQRTEITIPKDKAGVEWQMGGETYGNVKNSMLSMDSMRKKQASLV